MPSLPLSARAPKTAVRRPKQLTYYSLDNTRQQHVESKAELKYYYLPDSFLNTRPQLNQGYDKFIRRDESVDAHLTHLLNSITHYEKERNNGKRVAADIITYRGVMTRLLTIAQKVQLSGHNHRNNDDFIINIRYFDGQLFLELDHEFIQTQKMNETINKSSADKEKMDKMQYHGYKFEVLSMLPKPWSECSREEVETRDKKIVDNIAEFNTVVRSGVGKIKTVLGAEVDGLWDYDPSEHLDLFNPKEGQKSEKDDIEPLFEEESSPDVLSHYVELKTTMSINSIKRASSFLEHKLLSTWAQSFLVGVTRVVYGFRDEAGILKAVETYKTEDLPKMVQNSEFLSDNKRWLGNECISFYAAALQWILDTVPKDDTQVWRLKYTGGDDKLTLNRLDDPNHEQKLLDEMLLKEFVEWRNSLE